MIQGFFLKYAIGALVFAALAVALYFSYLRIENLKLQVKAEKNRAEAYAQTLQSYQDAFNDQVQALNIERQQEIRRQENLLRTLNLIGDLHEKDNTPMPDPSLSIIDSMYSDLLHRPGH